VLPSDKNEGVPQAVLQQLACERAVVVAAAGDIPEVVKNGQTGLLVPPGQAKPLAQAVTRLLDDAKLRLDLGRGGRRLVMENYSRQIMLSRTEEVYALALAILPRAEGR
jgi:glycosyltransferase involved in cell wall biosynthesis